MPRMPSTKCARYGREYTYLHACIIHRHFRQIRPVFRLFFRPDFRAKRRRLLARARARENLFVFLHVDSHFYYFTSMSREKSRNLSFSALRWGQKEKVFLGANRWTRVHRFEYFPLFIVYTCNDCVELCRISENYYSIVIKNNGKCYHGL